MQYLKLSTAGQVVRLGPFVDDTDFKTAETALSIANTDIKLYKGDAATSETNKNSGGATHVAAGRYHLTLDATDTNTVGRLDLHVKVSGALEVWKEFTVLAAHVYDSMFAVTGASHDKGIVDQGTAQSATSSTIVLRAAAAFANDELNGMVVVTTGGTGVGQARVITDYVSSTDTATVSPNWTTTPSGTIEYKVFASPPAPTITGALPQVDVREFGGTAGTFAAGRPEVNTSHISGSAVSTSTAQVGVNVVTSTGNSGIKKNAALNNFKFQMFDSTTHAPVTGKTVTVTRSIDNGSFAAGTLSAVTEISGGWYRCNFAAADMNGDVIAFRATATACDDTNLSFVTGA
jgi:hypothetical protein